MLTLDPEAFHWHFAPSLSLRLEIRFGEDFVLWHFSDEPTGRGCPVMADIVEKLGCCSG